MKVDLRSAPRPRAGGHLVLLALIASLALPVAAAPAANDDRSAWLPFEPAADPFKESAIDLRYLNEKVAGENGPISTRGGEFIHAGSGRAVRFWGVNGPPHGLTADQLHACARMLAKRGVNLVRIHTGYFDDKGEVNPKKIREALDIVDAMKRQGIYTHFSIYFPLWFKPKADNAFLKGYDGSKHPFAALFFNRDFQTQYREWWRALLTTPHPVTGKRLADDPAVACLEIQNEDSFFFWTFDERNIPDAQLRLLETMFGEWLAKRHGSISNAVARWEGVGVKRDAFAEGRAGFRPLWAMFNEKRTRDRDTTRFLWELQTAFYCDTRAFLKDLGFRGAITASNWATASPEVFGPLEKLSYATCDFIDRHGYFSCHHKGDNAEWSIRDGHTYADRSALRFDPETPGKPRAFVHPVMDPEYASKPSMISETTWNRPNRYRSEAPLYYAVYGALQGSDAIVHFALDGAEWSVKPNFWMQPWTLMSPSMMAQSPAAALIFRQGLVSTGDVVAEIDLGRDHLLELGGTPLPQDAALDELRAKDEPGTAVAGSAPENANAGPGLIDGRRLDPLLHYTGRLKVGFAEGNRGSKMNLKADLVKRSIDRPNRKVTSVTRELELDYGRGLLRIDAARAQGVSGHLQSAGVIETIDLRVQSGMDLGHIVAVALDDRPLASSSRVLLQVMSEERTSGFRAEPAEGGLRRIQSIGRDPWEMKALSGRVSFKRTDAARLQVTSLDHNGYSADQIGDAREIDLRRGTVYYLITSVP